MGKIDLTKSQIKTLKNALERLLEYNDSVDLMCPHEEDKQRPCYNGVGKHTICWAAFPRVRNITNCPCSVYTGKEIRIILMRLIKRYIK